MAPKNNIAEALATVRGGNVQVKSWLIPSASNPENVYVVEENPLSCTCFYFTNYFAETQKPCRHLWAGPGVQTALFIEAIWNATDQSALADAVEDFTPIMKKQNMVFVLIARQIYKDKLKALQFPKTEKPFPYKASKMANLVTPRQLVAIRSISNKKRVDPETLCLEQFPECKPEGLNRKAASWFIDFLTLQPEPKALGQGRIHLRIAAPIPA